MPCQAVPGRGRAAYSARMPLRQRPLDVFLVACFALFAFTSFVMEPYFVFGLGFERPGDPFAAGWLLYASRWDPIFLRPPFVLRLICGIDLFVFGPFYLLAIYGFLKRRAWVRMLGIVYATAMLYSLAVYFGIEFVEERGRADLPMVVLVNGPYALVPLLLACRLRRPDPFRSEPASACIDLPSSLAL